MLRLIIEYDLRADLGLPFLYNGKRAVIEADIDGDYDKAPRSFSSAFFSILLTYERDIFSFSATSR